MEAQKSFQIKMTTSVLFGPSSKRGQESTQVFFSQKVFLEYSLVSSKDMKHSLKFFLKVENTKKNTNTTLKQVV